MLRIVTPVILGAVFFGCSVETSGLGTGDAGAILDTGRDAPPTVDTGGTDAGPLDAGTPDAGPPDAGPMDAGPPDAGPPMMDGGPPDCRDMPETCDGIGGRCGDGGTCWPGLVCCTEARCGSGDPIGATCTVLGCGADRSTEACPLDMICYHSTCLFPCVAGTCPHPDMRCQHGLVCEWD